MRLENDKKLLISDLGLTKLDVSQKNKEITDLKNKLEEQEGISDSINKQLAESYESKNKLQKENCELNKKIEDYIITMDERQKQIVELIKKCDRQNAEIESLQSINNTLLNDNRKLSDELQEIKNKPFDPLKELDNLTIRKEENKTPEAKPKKKQSPKQ